MATQMYNPVRMEALALHFLIWAKFINFLDIPQRAFIVNHFFIRLLNNYFLSVCCEPGACET